MNIKQFILRVLAYITFLSGLTIMIKVIDNSQYYWGASIIMGLGLFWTIRLIILEYLQQQTQEKIK